MRYRGFGVLFFFSCGLLAQPSVVDRVSRQLESLATGAIHGWKVSPDLDKTSIAGDPTQAGFDDSGWDTLDLNRSIFPKSCWMRREVTLPTHIAGEPLAGPLRLTVTVDDYGDLWVNGESKGRFLWDGEFDLAEDARPGQTFVLAIKAFNTGGPLRLIRAGLKTGRDNPIRQMSLDLALSLRVAQKLLGFDTYQTSARHRVDPGVDKSSIDPEERRRLGASLNALAERLDVEALARGDRAAFSASVEDIRRGLKPIGAFAKRFTLYFDANAHIDAAWLWREKETVEVVKNTFGSVLNMMNIRPDFTYTQSAAAYYDWMKQRQPEIFEGMRRRVREGRWEVVGGMWVEPDCNLPSGDSWARHLLYSKRFFQRELGTDVTIGWNPDSFGYNLNIPMFYANAGIDAFITQKIGWNDTTVFPHRVFWWQSPDGSRILSYFPFNYVDSVERPFRLVDWMRQFEASTGFRRMLILFGVGDHGGGPSLEMIDRVERLATLDVFPQVEYGTTGNYLEWLKSQDLEDLPVWTDELYLEYHRGTYTTQARMKERNRRSEVLLTNAEKFSSLAALQGRPYSAEKLESAWRNVLFNQFHDILPGSGIREVYIDSNARFDEAEALAGHELRGSLEWLASRVDTAFAVSEQALVVFNPLSWQRTDLVTVDLPEGDDHPYSVVDAEGRPVPSQIESVDRLHRRLLFVAEDVPSMGYASYTLRRRVSQQGAGAPTASGGVLENAFFRLEIDPETGWLKSIRDKRLDKEVLAGAGNELQLFEDRPSDWDAWNIGRSGVRYASTLRDVEVVEQGPVRTTIRVTRDYLKPGTNKRYPTEDFPSSFFVQDIRLYNGLDRIEFRTEVDWWEDHTMLKVAFPLAAADDKATFEIPFGTIQRSTRNQTEAEKAQFEVSGRWADLSQDDWGVTLLTRSKYGFDLKGSLMRLSLLRSPEWPDPTADRGKHAIEYALYPHRGRVTEAPSVRQGYAFNTPLLVVVQEPHPGPLPARHSFLRLGPDNLVLTTMKKAEDGDGWIVQWYDPKGAETQAELTLPQPPRAAFRSNFLEVQGEAIPVSGDVIRVKSPSKSVVTINVVFGSGPSEN